MDNLLKRKAMFKDRKDAALHLAKALEKYKGTDAIVLGIPRGGAETAFYVARHLGLEFSLLVSKKLGHPDNPEYAIGAMAEDGSIYLNQNAQAGISHEVLEQLKEQQQLEIKRRIKALRKDEPLPDLHGKTVLLVDDGIATGATVFAAISMCYKKGAGKVVVAAPVSGREKVTQLLRVADEVVVLDTPDFYRGVSQAYAHFANLTDQEVMDFMERSKLG